MEPNPDFVLNVISDEAAALAIEMRGLGRIVWLAAGRAFDIVGECCTDGLLDEARALTGARAADINRVATAGRRKAMLVADMDSTIIGCECLDELADFAGLKPKVAAITERAMRGEIDFAPALRERVALLKGLPLDALQSVYDSRVRLNPGARELVATMRAHGAYTLLVSGGFTFFTERVARDAGFDAQQANVILDDGARLTGKVADPILGREAKLEALEQAAQARGLDPSQALAVGDGANDLAMIARAGMGVAWHAKPVVAAAAGARIDHGDLTALLYLQGYRKDEIVNARA